MSLFWNILQGQTRFFLHKQVLFNGLTRTFVYSHVLKIYFIYIFGLKSHYLSEERKQFVLSHLK